METSYPPTTYGLLKNKKTANGQLEKLRTALEKEIERQKRAREKDKTRKKGRRK